MLRSPVLTRTADSSDIPALLGLLDELRHIGGRAERAVSPIESDDLEGRLIEVMAGPDSSVVLAEVDGSPVGLAIMRLVRPDPLSDARVVQLARLVVKPSARHRGVGQALIGVAATFASERHVDQVAVSVYPSVRDASRFYARLGFAPAAMHRVAPLSLLRRRLGLDRVAGDGSIGRRRTRLTRPVPPQRLRRTDRQKV